MRKLAWMKKKINLAKIRYMHHRSFNSLVFPKISSCSPRQNKLKINLSEGKLIHHGRLLRYWPTGVSWRFRVSNPPIPVEGNVRWPILNAISEIALVLKLWALNSNWHPFLFLKLKSSKADPWSGQEQGTHNKVSRTAWPVECQTWKVNSAIHKAARSLQRYSQSRRSVVGTTPRGRSSRWLHSQLMGVSGIVPGKSWNGRELWGWQLCEQRC